MRVLGILCPLSLLAQSPARPIVGAIDTGRTVARHDTTLSNGVRLTLARMGRSPKALVRFVLSTGAEPASACGLTAVLAHAMDMGSSQALTDSVGHMGGRLTVSVRPERVELDADVLSEFAGTALEVIGGIVRAPRLEEASHPDEIRAVAGTLDAPGSADTAGMWALRNAVFPGGQFNGGCPIASRLSTYGFAEVDGYYQSRIGPLSTSIAVVGRFDDRSVLRAAQRALGDWRNGNERSGATGGGNTAVVTAPALVVLDRAGVKQSAILVGARVPGPADSDYASLRVADAVLGANVVSRITMNIREAKGYAYSPGSVIVTAPSGASYWVELGDVGTIVTWPAFHEILVEIGRLARAEPQGEEVEGAQRYLLGRSLVETATRTGWADDNELLSATSDASRAPSAGRRRLLDVTSADVRRVVAAYLAPHRLTVVVVADTTALAGQMAAIRDGFAKP